MHQAVPGDSASAAAPRQSMAAFLFDINNEQPIGGKNMKKNKKQIKVRKIHRKLPPV